MIDSSIGMFMYGSTLTGNGFGRGPRYLDTAAMRENKSWDDLNDLSSSNVLGELDISVASGRRSEGKTDDDEDIYGNVHIIHHIPGGRSYHGHDYQNLSPRSLGLRDSSGGFRQDNSALVPLKTGLSQSLPPEVWNRTLTAEPSDLVQTGSVQYEVTRTSLNQSVPPQKPARLGTSQSDLVGSLNLEDTSKPVRRKLASDFYARQQPYEPVHNIPPKRYDAKDRYQFDDGESTESAQRYYENLRPPHSQQNFPVSQQPQSNPQVPSYAINHVNRPWKSQSTPDMLDEDMYRRSEQPNYGTAPYMPYGSKFAAPGSYGDLRPSDHQFYSAPEVQLSRSVGELDLHSPRDYNAVPMDNRFQGQRSFPTDRVALEGKFRLSLLYI